MILFRLDRAAALTEHAHPLLRASRRTPCHSRSYRPWYRACTRDTTARQKRPSFPPRSESRHQREEREARVTELLERVRHHQEQATIHQQRADEHQQKADRFTESAKRRQAQGLPERRKKPRP